MTPDDSGSVAVGRAAPAGLRLLFIGASLAGIAGFWIGTAQEPRHTWTFFLVNLIFWTGIAAAGPVFAAILHVTHARWAGSLRRVAEDFGAFLPLSCLLLLLLMAGLDWIYPWVTHPPPGRILWFRPRVVMARDMGALALCTVAALVFVRSSRRGRGEQHAGAAVTLLLVYPFTFSLLVIDLVMSITPTWVSTLFPAYFFMGNLYAAVAALVLVSRSPLQRGDVLPDPRARDMGAILLGLSMFWMYLFWSQYLVIWYGNLAEEIQFILARTGSGWKPWSWAVIVLCFGAPFCLLLSRAMKRPAALSAVSIVVLAGMWLERLFLVAPSLESEPLFLATDPLIAAGFAGLFALSQTELAGKW